MIDNKSDESRRKCDRIPYSDCRNLRLPGLKSTDRQGVFEKEKKLE